MIDSQIKGSCCWSLDRRGSGLLLIKKGVTGLCPKFSGWRLQEGEIGGIFLTKTSPILPPEDVEPPESLCVYLSFGFLWLMGGEIRMVSLLGWLDEGRGVAGPSGRLDEGPGVAGQSGSTL